MKAVVYFDEKNINYMQNLNDTNELIYKTETHINKLWLPKGKGGNKLEKFEINSYKQIYKQINNQDLQGTMFNIL